MKEKEINLHFTNHGSGTGEEIIIRHGEAAAPVELTGYTFSGDINCVIAYMQAKKDASPLQRPVQETSVVEINSKEMSVTLRIDPHQPNAAVVSGKLELSNELEPFKINKPTTFSRESLVKLLRHNKALFPNKEQYESLLGAYMSFSAQAVIDMKASSDTRGNKAGSYSKAVNS